MRIFKILLSLLLGISLQMKGQERINRVELKFEQSSGIIDSVAGWAYSETYGKWISYKNVISEEKDAYWGETMMSKTKQNFIKLQTKSFISDSIKYYVLIVTQWEGWYKYPNIREDWRELAVTYGYIFENTEYHKLDSINGKIELKALRSVESLYNYKNFDDAKFLDLLQSSLEKDLGNYSGHKFPIMKSKEGKIRFYLPEMFSSISNYDFDKRYFEISLENFNNLIIKNP